MNLIERLRECHSYGCDATEPPYKLACSCSVGALCSEAADALEAQAPTLAEIYNRDVPLFGIKPTEVRDAARYRWLRERLTEGISVHADPVLGIELLPVMRAISGGSFDAAIDAAMSKPPAEKT